MVFAQFADFALQGAEEVVRGDGVGVELFGVVVFVEEAGEVALFFAVAGDEGVAVVVVFGAGVAGAAAFGFPAARALSSRNQRLSTMSSM